MQLRTKLLIIFLSISIVPVAVFTFFTYSRYDSLMDAHTSQLAGNLMDRAAEEANRSLGHIQNIQESINYDSVSQDSLIDELHRYCGSQYEYTSRDIYHTNQIMQTICQNKFQTYSWLNGIYIFTPSGEVLGFGRGTDVRYGYQPFRQEWYRQTVSKEGGLYIDGITQKDFLLNGAPSIAFSTALYDVFSKDFLGVLYIDCSPRIFDLYLVNTMPENVSLTIRKGDAVLCQSGADIQPEEAGQNVDYYTTALLNDELVLHGYMNRAEMNAEARFTLVSLLAMGFFLAALFLVLSVYLSRYITKPISLLSDRMSGHDIEAGVADEPYMNRTDEIGVLYNEYEAMIGELNRYVKNELQNQLVIMNSQMRTLEAQINAHFLYNTLEAISSLAAIEEAPEISTMAEALSAMFRYSIKTKSELVTLKEELDHVKNYIAIQQIRFDNGFYVEWEVPEEDLSLRVLKLILQPLVENALYHGLLSCNAGSRIRIFARHSREALAVTVEDDGVGMTPEAVQSLRESLEEPPQVSELGYKNKQSIGIRNIHVRIALYYGSGYGISLESREGEGSMFTVTIPLLS